MFEFSPFTKLRYLMSVSVVVCGLGISLLTHFAEKCQPFTITYTGSKSQDVEINVEIFSADGQMLRVMRPINDGDSVFDFTHNGQGKWRVTRRAGGIVEVQSDVCIPNDNQVYVSVRTTEEDGSTSYGCVGSGATMEVKGLLTSAKEGQPTSINYVGNFTSPLNPEGINSFGCDAQITF